MKRSSLLQASFTILMLLAFAFSMVGVFTSYLTYLHRESFQSEVKSARKNELKKISFTTSEFGQIRWEEKNKEFEYHGKMYDVSSIECKDNIYTVICENDFVEELLIGILKSSGQKSKSKTPQLQLFEPIPFLELKSIKTTLVNGVSYYPLNIPTVSIEDVSPPPRFS